MATAPHLSFNPAIGKAKNRAECLVASVMLTKLLATNNLSPWKLDRLLGATGTSLSKKWIYGQHMPSPKHANRLAYLWSLIAEGVKLQRVRTIDWDILELQYWPGAEPETQPEPARARLFDIPSNRG